MPSTTYVDFRPPAVNAEWLNEVNDYVFDSGGLATPSGGTQAAMQVLLQSMGYSPFVPYIAGLVMGSADQTVLYQNAVYAPNLADLPFTTSGAFEAAKFHPATLVDETGGEHIGLDDKAAGANYTTLQAFRDYLAAPTGAAGVGFIQAGTGAVATDLQTKARESLSVADFAAPTDGTTSATAEIGSAATAAGKTKNLHFTAGNYATQGLTYAVNRQHWTGLGWASETDSAERPGASLLKNANGTHLTINTADSSVRDLHLDGVKATYTGGGVVIGGQRAYSENLSVVSQVGDGIKLGDNAVNGNLWLHHRPISVGNDGRGCYISHTSPDINAGVMVGADFRSNGGVGLEIGNASDNVFVGPAIQTNTGVGLKITPTAHGHKFFGVYAEANLGSIGTPGSEILIQDGATGNAIFGTRSAQSAGSGAKDESSAGENVILSYDTAFNQWAWRKHFLLWNPLDATTPETTAEFKFAVGPYNAVVETSVIAASIDGSTGGRHDVYTKIDGGALARHHSIRASGDQYFENAANGFLFGKTVFDTTTTGFYIQNDGGRVNITNSGAGAKTIFAFYDASGAAGSVSTNGSGTTTYATTSDRRLKTEIVNAPAQGALIDSIQIREFEFKAAPGIKQIGVIADELQAVAPAAVVGEVDALDKDGNILPQGVDPSKLVFALIKEVQSLRARVAALEP